MEWSLPEEPSCSRLDEWVLPGRHQAPRQRASPFFLEVHDEITMSWRPPYSSCLRASSSSALTSVNGKKKKKVTTACLHWMSQWPCISARLRPLAGRQKPLTHLSHAGLLQLSLDEPIHQFDRRPRRFIPWRSCKCSRQNSSVLWTSRTQTLQLS